MQTNLLGATKQILADKESIDTPLVTAAKGAISQTDSIKVAKKENQLSQVDAI